VDLAADPTFGPRLRQLREAAGLTQAELARQIDVSRQFINLLESGESDPSWVTVRKLAAVLGVSVAAFEGSPPPRPVGKRK
jgi:putative transcriptional regulator